MVNKELHQSRARHAWPLLVQRAKSRGKCYTYAEISAAIGVHCRAAGGFLGVIQEKCREEGWPMLQALAVSRATGVPGGGYHGERTKEQHEEELARVRNKTDWPDEAPF